MGMQVLPTGVYGPLPQNSVGLLLGRSSWTMKRLQIAPGIIDSDFTGEIKIMACAPKNIVSIPSGQHIAQCIMLPTMPMGKIKNAQPRGGTCFGSSDAYWIQNIKETCPELELLINGHKFMGILDTGADVSVISLNDWPKNWSKQVAISTLRGIGQSHNPEQSSELLKWKDAEGHEGHIQPYILPNIPVNLWGRDVMKQMGVYIFAPNDAVSQMLLNKGLLPNQGLGKNGEGNLSPTQTKTLPLRSGLGYF